MILFALFGSKILLSLSRTIHRYFVQTNALSIEHTAALGAKLVRNLIADEDELFLSKPLTWNH